MSIFSLPIHIKIWALLLLGFLGLSFGCNPYRLQMPEGLQDISFDMTPEDLLMSGRQITPHKEFLYVESCVEETPCEEVVYKFEEDTKKTLRLIFVRYGPGLGKESLYNGDDHYHKLLEVAEQTWGDTEKKEQGSVVIYYFSETVVALICKEPFPAIWIGSKDRLGELLF